MFSAASVCLFVGEFVCQHDNFRTRKHRMMKLGGRCIVQKVSAEPPLDAHPPKMWRCATTWENQRMLSIVYAI